jgi:hypothetical protein
LPAIVEADDLGLYVLKFRGAGQGPLALVAELVAGEIGRALGLPVPEIVFVEVDSALSRNEPDEEIRDLLQASAGLNLALDYLPGSVMFDPAAGDRGTPEFASRTVWFDAFVMNVDRTPHNANLLLWHKKPWLIDHGAALYFQHDWQSRERMAASPFTAIRPSLSGEVFSRILADVPDDWLSRIPDSDPRSGYLQFLTARLNAADVFTEEAIRARNGA